MSRDIDAQGSQLHRDVNAVETPGDATQPLGRLLDVMAKLRDPINGCPWDKKQTFASIAPYTIEEAYEVADAIERRDYPDLKDELGDLLLQVVYHARIAEEQELFAFPDVAAAIGDKMIRRHPHVFGGANGSEHTHAARWEEIKAAERAEKSASRPLCTASILDGIAAGLPAFTRSAKLQKRAAHVGFDWPSIDPRLAKLDEEIAEFKHEIAAPDSDETYHRRFEEFGDVMFVLVNIAMHLGIDAESALRAANTKFAARIVAMETMAAADGGSLHHMTLDEMEALWQRAKSGKASGQK